MMFFVFTKPAVGIVRASSVLTFDRFEKEEFLIMVWMLLSSVKVPPNILLINIYVREEVHAGGIPFAAKRTPY